jgi:methylated-DNA-[protein]-cysteine S-methyltransferase
MHTSTSGFRTATFALLSASDFRQTHRRGNGTVAVMISQRTATPATDPSPPLPKIETPPPTTNPTRFAELPSAVGELLVTADADGRLTRLQFHDGPWTPASRSGWVRDESAFAEVARQLDAYFAGELRDFELALAPAGTPFQLQVWRALCAIPYGETASYGDVARAVGQPGAARAVGGANNRNPIAIVVPCHRVIGAGGSLTGYGGGIERKRRLLALESGTPALI